MMYDGDDCCWMMSNRSYCLGWSYSHLHHLCVDMYVCMYVCMCSYDVPRTSFHDGIGGGNHAAKAAAVLFMPAVGRTPTLPPPPPPV